MAGPTDLLTEDVKDLRESNKQLAAEIKGAFERVSGELRESNLRLTDALSGLTRDFGNFRVEVAKDLGAINANLEGFRGRTETSFKVAVWGITLAVGSILGGFGAAITLTWRAAHVDATVAELREHSKEQDRRIANLIELESTHRDGYGRSTPKYDESPGVPRPYFGPDGKPNVPPSEPPKTKTETKTYGPDGKLKSGS